ncbi:GFA family protein [Aestuariivirga litoralis]|uniref:GFA family protein n=1 Tax=Aestuariivirga litoralis TaxID=2650924 RepID=UPI0018C5BD4F|nr:GFA family protein [Aestuariivirga litoralis]MBG1231458.1 GFA family protein [Aestuariivirga litoralis]
MAEQTYTGGCQCGAVRIEVQVDLDKTRTCNCSRCQALGAVWGYTSLDKLKVLSGEDQLTTFTFNRNVGQHKFCKICGIESFAVGSIAVINANCLDGVDPRALKPEHANGRAT